MASITVDISSIFSQLKQFSWAFTINYNPTSITCVATSEDVARQTILNFITKLDDMTKGYRQAKDRGVGNIYEIRDKLPSWETLDASMYIGCYTTEIYDFHLGMEIGYRGQTLEDFIKMTSPTVSPFKLISVYSCLDG